MGFRDLRDRASFYAFRDVSVEEYNSRREFSEPLVRWVRLEPRSPMRLIEDQNALGTENTTTHTATCMWFSHDQYTAVEICGRLYRLLNRVQDKSDRRLLVLGLSYISECSVSEMSRPAFLDRAV